MATKKNTPLQSLLSGAGEKLKTGLGKLSESGLLENPAVVEKLGSTKLGQKLGGAEGITKLMGGGGGESELQPAATVVADTDLTLSPIKPWEVADTPVASPEPYKAKSDSSLDALSSMVSEMKTANESRMKGQISGDVADQIRINAAEVSGASGIGVDSPAARALTARDLGLTSMDIQERGLATAGQIAGIQSEIVKLSENRYQFTEQLAQSQRAFREQSRQFGATLEQDAIRIQLAYKELVMRQEMFNAEQNLRLVSLVSQLVTSQAQLQVQAASAEVGDEAITAAFDDMILNIGALLKKSNPTGGK